jgi:hypothetical protein
MLSSGYPEWIVVAAEGQIVCEHRRIIERSHHLPGRTIYDWCHDLAVIQRTPSAVRNRAPFAELPEAFNRLQMHLSKRLSDDREVLAIPALVLRHYEHAVQPVGELCTGIDIIELGGDLAQPTRRGYGSKLLERVLPSDLGRGAFVAMLFESTGLRFVAPLSRLLRQTFNREGVEFGGFIPNG